MARNWSVVVISIYRCILIGGGIGPPCTGIFNNHRQFRIVSLFALGILLLSSMPRLVEKFALIEPNCEDFYETLLNDSSKFKDLQNRSNTNIYVVFGLVPSKEFERLSLLKIISHGILSFLFQTQVPIILIVMANLLICIRMLKYKSELSDGNPEDQDEQKFKIIRRSNAEKTVFMVSVGFTILELPSYFNKLLFFIVSDEYINLLHQFSYVANFFTVLDSFFNFFIYIFANGEFRTAIWRCLGGRVNEEQNRSTEIASIRMTNTNSRLNIDANNVPKQEIELIIIEPPPTADQTLYFSERQPLNDFAN